MNGLKARVKKLEALHPGPSKKIFFWKPGGKSVEELLAGLSPEERERAVIFQWEIEEDGPSQGPVDPVGGNWGGQ